MDTELEVLTRITAAFDAALDNALATRDAALAELTDDDQRARATAYIKARFAARFAAELFPRRRAQAGDEGASPARKTTGARRGPKHRPSTPTEPVRTSSLREEEAVSA